MQSGKKILEDIKMIILVIASVTFALGLIGAYIGAIIKTVLFG